MDSSGLPQAATRVRFAVVAFAVALAAVTYLDRACIAALAPDIMQDLALTKEQMSVVYSAFALAYAAFEIPTAWWADRRGTRRVLTRIVSWWSVFTMLTGAAWNWASLVVTRFLFGAGEAGAWPSAARTFSRWIPRSERGRVQGIFFAGAHLMGGLTPMIVAALLAWTTWRGVFVVFGLVGLVWAFAWYRWFRDEPSEHPAVNRAELEQILAGRESGGTHHAGWAYWKRLLGHSNTYALCLMYFPNSFGFYFCITWLPTYLREKHGLAALSQNLFAGLPLLLSVAGDLFGGAATDFATRRFGPRIGRAGVGMTAYVVAGAAMLLAAVTTQPWLAASLIGLAVGASMFTLGAAWSTCLDVGGNHAGVVSAAMNTSGQVGSILCPLLVTWLLGRFGDWNAALFMIGGVYLVGATAWAFVNPRRHIFD
ncbi:MAG: MFS transporter [Verrucomicrobiae bacterium]|nr:MFS transporter [Verrucomicrobiae bacterium]